MGIKMAPYYKETRFKRMGERFLASSRNSQTGPIDPSRPPGDIAEIHPEIARALKGYPGMDKPYDNYKGVPDSVRYGTTMGKVVTIAGGITKVIELGQDVYNIMGDRATANELLSVRTAIKEQLPAGNDYSFQVYNINTKDEETVVYRQAPSYGPGIGPQAHVGYERGANPNPAVISDRVVVYGERKLHFARVYDGSAADREPHDITKHGGEVPADAKFDRGYPVEREPGKLDPGKVA